MSLLCYISRDEGIHAQLSALAQAYNWQCEVVRIDPDEDFIAVLRTYGKPPALMMLDSGDIDVPAIAPALRRHYPEIPILLLYREQTVEAKLEAWAAYVDALIRTPLKPYEVTPLIGRLLQNEGRVSQSDAQESFSLYHKITSECDDFISYVGTDYIYRSVSDSYCRVFKKKKNEIIGHSVQEIFGDAIFQNVIKARVDRCFSGETVRFEDWYDLPDARYCYSVTYYPSFNEKGVVIGADVIARDITSLRLAEAQVEHSEQRYRFIFENNPIAMLIFHKETQRILEINEAGCQLYGYTAEELQGKLLTEIFQSLPCCTLNGSEAVLFEGSVCHRRKDGSELFVEVSMKPCDQLGEQAELVMIYDMTETLRTYETLKTALQKSEQSQQETRALLDASRLVNESRSFIETAKRIFNSCKKLVGATAGYVALLSDQGDENEVLFLDAGGRPCTVDPSLPMPIRGLRERAYREHRTVYDNGFASSEWMAFMPSGHVGLDNVMFAPLVVDNVVVGIIGLANKPEPFTAEDARIASAFGDIASLALQKSRFIDKLESSEKKYRAVVDTAQDGIITCNAAGEIISWNRGAELLFGYSRNDMMGKSILRLIPGRYVQQHEERFAEASREGLNSLHAHTFSIHGLTREGAEIPLELSLARWKIDEELFFTAILRDMRERYAVEEALRYSDRRFRNLIDSSEDWIWETDTSCSLVFASEAMKKALGLTDETLTQKSRRSIFEFMSASEATLLHDQYRQVMQTHTPVKGVLYAIATPGRKERFIESTIVPVLDDKGVCTGLWGLDRDLTDRLHAQEAVRKSEKMFRGLFDSSRDGIVIVDINGMILDSNERFSEMTGFSRETLVSREFSMLLRPQERSMMESIMTMQVWQRGYSEVFEMEVIRADGSTFQSSWRSYLQFSDKTVFVHTVRDITLQKKLERERELMLHDMQERIKEFSCLYAISVAAWGCDDEQEYLNEVVAMLPPSMQYPQDARARITLSGSEYRSGEFQQTPWCLHCPIIIDGQEQGAIEICYRRKMPELDLGAFLYEEQQLLESVSYSISQFVETTRARRVIDVYQKKLRALSLRITSLEEIERKRIAQELHDEIAQKLAIARIKLDALKGSIPEACAVDMEFLSTVIEEVVHDTRHLMLEISPHSLLQLGFYEALEWLSETIEKKYSLEVELRCPQRITALDPATGMGLFRAVREALINVVKHASASTALVVLTESPEQGVMISVEDNGCGFDPEGLELTREKHLHFGIFHLQQNLQLLGGNVTVASETGHGTTITINLPLERTHEEENSAR